METLFWCAVIFILYAYAGYPLLLLALSCGRHRPVKKGNITPTVSLIITAYNEEDRIRGKIENSLALDYPRDRIELIVASDCSTDQTDRIVQFFETQGIRLVRAAQRHGKEAAQKLGVDAAGGEILVFSDVATILPPDAISNIVKNFYDPTVGCVSSVDKIIDAQGKVSGEGAYVSYEMLLRSLETKANTLVGLSGSFFAARREVCRNWRVELQSDFNSLLNSVRLGLRGVSDPESIGYYKSITDETKEYERKVRTVLRGIAVFMKSLALLNPRRYGMFSWQLLSHKLCRWLVPFAMILAFFCSGYLAVGSFFYRAVFILQLAFYGIAWINQWTRLFKEQGLLRIPWFLVMANLSILTAWCRYFRGERMVSWVPSAR